MTMITLFDRIAAPAMGRCECCDRPAWAATPHGMRCHEHAVTEVRRAVAEGSCDWVPRVLRRRSR